MASSNRSASEPGSTVRRIRNRIERLMEPIWEPLGAVLQFVTSSFFRFMLILGLVFLITGALRGEGVIAGHLLIYGATAILLGAVGRAVTRWKLKNST